MYLLIGGTITTAVIAIILAAWNIRRAKQAERARDDGIVLLAEAHAQLKQAGEAWDQQIKEQARTVRLLELAEQQRDEARKELAALKAGIHAADSRDTVPVVEAEASVPPIASEATANGKRPRGSRKRAAE